ncbi:hypothetical protein ACFYM7_08500 [Streptomyces cyaneofuscatus]|uniref:hypothetical protein n=1 Tax=Streptomyces cyaneofuscatus TaxID=66883 RepID=UPI0036A69896
MHPPIPLLERLREFDGSVDDFYASGFELLPSGEDDGGYPQLSDRIRPFAQANGSGSTYAIWLRDDRADLATLPVLFLGDEGGGPRRGPRSARAAARRRLRLVPDGRLGQPRLLRRA